MTPMKARSVTSCIGASAVSGWPDCRPAGSGEGVRWKAMPRVARGEPAAAWAAWEPDAVISLSGRFAFFARFLGLLLEDFLEDLGHVFNRIKNRPRHEDRALLLQRQDDRITGTGVELDDFLSQ